MIYLNAFYVVEMQLLKSGPSREKVVRGGGEWGKWGKKLGSESPYIHYSCKIHQLMLNLLSSAANECSVLSYNQTESKALSQRENGSLLPRFSATH